MEQSDHPPPSSSSQQPKHRISQSHNHSAIQVTSQSAKQAVVNQQQVHMLSNSASQSHNANTPVHTASHYHHKKKHKKQKGAAGQGSTSHSLTDHQHQKTPLHAPSYHPQMMVQ